MRRLVARGAIAARAIALAQEASGAAAVELADQALRHARLPLPIIVGDVVGVVAAVSGDFPGVELAAAAIVGFDAIALAQATSGATAVELADQAFRHARLPLPVVVGDVIRIITAVSGDFPWVELASASVISFDLVPFLQTIAVTTTAARGPDQALRHPRLALAVVVGDVVRIITAVSADLSRIEFAAPAVVGLDLVALAEGAAVVLGHGTTLQQDPRPVDVAVLARGP